MTATLTEIEHQVDNLSTLALEAFCEDISSVFNLEVKYQKQDVISETVKELKKRFGKIAAVNNIDSTGIFDGSFQVIFDQDGIFTLGGVIVMQPEDEILANRKNGSVKLAENMTDAMGEAGNLLVKSWDRILESEVEGNCQLEQRLPIIIGKNWQKSIDSMTLSKDHELILILYQMTINSFDPFQCGVLFPKEIFKDDFNSESELTTDTPEQDDEVKQEAEITNTADKKDSAEQTETKTKEKVNTSSKQSKKSKPKATRKNSKTRKSKTSKAIQKMTESPGEPTGKSGRSQKTKTMSSKNIDDLLQIPAKDIMQNHIVWAGPEESVGQINEKIKHNNVSHILVGQNGVVEGIVSEFDISGAMSPYLRPIFSKWHRPSDDATLQIKIKWIMSKPVHTVKVDTPIEEIMENMNRFTGHALPVTDEQNHVLGIVTDHDIFRTLLISKQT